MSEDSAAVNQQKGINYEPASYLELIKNWPETKTKLLEEYFTNKFEELPVRCANNLRKHFKGKPKVDLFIFTILDNNFDINRIKNSGVRTQEDLKIFIQKVQSFISELNTSNLQKTTGSIEALQKLDMKNNEYKAIINTFTEAEITVLQNHLENQIYLLPTRAKNCLLFFFKGKIDLNQFTTNFLDCKTDQFPNLKNAGKKTYIDIKALVKDFKAYIQLLNTPDGKAKVEETKLELFLRSKVKNKSIPYYIFNKPSIFTLTDFLLKNDGCFDRHRTYIALNSLKIFKQSEYKGLDFVAENINLTRERVRQIRLDLLKNFKSHFSFIRELNEKDKASYDIDINENFISISEEKANLINQKNETQFTPTFLTFLISILLEDKFQLFGSLDNALTPQLKNSVKPSSNTIYLINKEKENLFPFSAFLEEISKKLDTTIDKTYKLPLKGLVFKHIDSALLNDIDEILSICEELLIAEFNLVPDVDGNIIFERNSKRKKYEYAFEALEQLGEPSKIEEILNKIKALYPNYKTSIEKVRASMKRKDGFVSIGRKSVYGLKKWEKEKESFKGGTIRSITVEYLRDLGEPQHISDILDYVLKFRPKTNERSVLQNLKLEDNGTFVFFAGSKVGLSNKNYDEIRFSRLTQKNTRPPKTWEESYHNFKLFIDANNRLPKNSEDQHETDLYRWYYVQKTHVNSGKLKGEKLQLIMEIIRMFPSKRIKKPVNLETRYEELIEFVKHKQRLPIKGNPEEDKLLNFYNIQRKLFEMNQLNEINKKLFNKVILTITTYE
jgi:hypothetical protein